MTDRIIEVPGGRLRARDEGDPANAPILMIHAGIAQLESWDGVAPLLVDAGYRVIRHDMRGWGQSTTDDVEFSHAADVVAVLDAFGVGRAALVGNSMGGVRSIDTALAYPDRVVAIVGVAAGLAGFDGPMTAAEIEVMEEMERLEAAEPLDGAAIAAIDIRAWVDGPEQPEGRAPAWIREAIREWDTPLYAAGHVGGTSIPLDPPANDRLAELACPILAIAGSLDFTEVEATAGRIESGAPHARALVWPDVAHMIGMEVPDRLAETIIEFLAPLPRWS